MHKIGSIIIITALLTPHIVVCVYPTLDISNECYLCLGTDKENDNIAKCSMTQQLDIERCPTEDMFDKCLVFQAFSLKQNMTVFRRECSSDRFCSSDVLCADPDFVQCKARCCSGDMCNDFDFEDEEYYKPIEEVKPEVHQPLQCYFCDKSLDGNDNTDLCAVTEDSSVERCPSDDIVGYTCLSLQTYTASTNTVTAVRKCLPKMLCKEDVLCLYPDPCNYTCCNHDLCNGGQLTIDVGTTNEKVPTIGSTPSTSVTEEKRERADKCYYCIGDEEGVDNVASCSVQRGLETEYCSQHEEGIDRCLVYQAFSIQKNTTIFRRECMPSSECNTETLCADPDMKDCQFSCCKSDYCNDFNFDMVPTLVPTVVDTRESNGDSAGAPGIPDVSSRCYYCSGENEFEDNIETCSDLDNLPTEYCSADDHYDRCVVYKAFSVSKNTIIVRRECASNRVCERKDRCSDDDHVNCQRECCFGDYCNSFDLQETTTIEEIDGDGPTEDITDSLVPVTDDPMIDIMDPDHDGCYDKDPLCPEYAENAYGMEMFCEKNDQYTMYLCRKTCKFCSDPSDKVQTNNPFSPTTRALERETNPIYYTEGDIEGPGVLKTRKPRVLRSDVPAIDKYITDTKPTTEPISSEKPPITERQYQIKTYRSHLSTKSVEDHRDDCADIRDDCNTMVINPGYCDYAKDYMIIYCRKSCNLCREGQVKPDTGGGDGVAAPEVTTEPPTQPLKRVNYVDWVIGSWGECIGGERERTVRCYHNLRGKMYEILINVCIKLRGPMANAKEIC